MCLQRITKTEGLKDGYGYKVFRWENGKMSCQYAWCEPKTNKWIAANDFPPRQYNGLQRRSEKYELGWHIFTNKRDALQNQDLDRHGALVVRKIKYRKPTTLGKWGNARTIVAKEIRILGEVE